LTGLIVAVIGAAGLRLYDQDMLSERLQSLRAITELFTTYAQTLDARVRNGALTRAIEVKAEALMTGVSAAAIEQRGAATGEIVRSVARAAEGTEAVTGAIADVSRGTDETGGAAERVLGAATEMSAKSGQLSEAIHRFLDGIRAA
jgi:hypothetical protein